MKCNVGFVWASNVLIAHPPKACVLMFVHGYNNYTNLSASPRIRTNKNPLTQFCYLSITYILKFYSIICIISWSTKKLSNNFNF